MTVFPPRFRAPLLCALLLAAANPAAADLALFGPGGPAPAMKEAAATFTAETGIPVSVTAGPAGKWMPDAQMQADAIFTGSQNMMDDFVVAHGATLPETITPLFLRPSAILVRKGNPDGITGLRDLIERDLKFMVVDGAGQVGLWEDMIGRTRNIADMAAFRGSIDHLAPNSGAARSLWTEDDSFQAWLIWNHWQIDNPDIADMVPVEPDLVVYRDTSIVTTQKGADNPELAQFIDYLNSAAGMGIFAKHGWQKSF